jgi:hypothetical protein
MPIKRAIYLLLILSFSSCIVAAQPYEHAIGIKAGYSSGIIYKMLAYRGGALSGQALYNNHGFQFTALYEYQFTPYAKKRLYYYAGGGLHAGDWEDEFSLGIALSLGSEFVFRKAPLTAGLEWKPMVNLYKTPDYAIPDIALTVKVILR